MTNKAPNRRPTRREIKRAVRATLAAEDFGEAIEGLLAFPLRSLCSALIGDLAAGDERMKRRAVEALGIAVARLAEDSLEGALDVLRRLHWSLTEEAGSIGWGAPEAMGEVLARHPGLARRYASILVSYLSELDYPPLLCGALWGIARLAEKEPGLLREKGAAKALTPHLASEDPDVRAGAIRAFSLLESHPGDATPPTSRHKG